MVQTVNLTTESAQTVSDVMFDPIAVVERPAHLAAAAYLMQQNETAAIVVIDNEGSREPVGIITARDIVRAVAHGGNPAEEHVQAWETPKPESVRPDTPLDKALDLMVDKHFLQLPVVNNEQRLVGMVDLFCVAHERRITASEPAAGAARGDG
jgi:CBS domain-containing protein